MYFPIQHIATHTTIKLQDKQAKQGIQDDPLTKQPIDADTDSDCMKK